MDGPVLGAVSRDFLKRRDRRGGGRAADGAAGGEREATRDDRSGPASRSLTLSRSQRASEGRLSHVWCERGNAFIPQIRDFPTAVANVLLYLPILKDIVGLFGVMDASAATIRTRGRPLSSLFPPFSLLVQFFKAFSLFQSFSSRFSLFHVFTFFTFFQPHSGKRLRTGSCALYVGGMLELFLSSHPAFVESGRARDARTLGREETGLLFLASWISPQGSSAALPHFDESARETRTTRPLACVFLRMKTRAHAIPRSVSKKSAKGERARDDEQLGGVPVLYIPEVTFCVCSVWWGGRRTARPWRSRNAKASSRSASQPRDRLRILRWAFESGSEKGSTRLSSVCTMESVLGGPRARPSTSRGGTLDRTRIGHLKRTCSSFVRNETQIDTCEWSRRSKSRCSAAQTSCPRTCSAHAPRRNAERSVGGFRSGLACRILKNRADALERAQSSLPHCSMRAMTELRF